MEEELDELVRPSTAQRYRVSLGPLMEFLGDIETDRLSVHDLHRYVSHRRSVAKNATIRRDMTALSGLLRACQAWGWATTNPALAFDRKRLPERREEITPPEPSHVEWLLANAPRGMAEILRVLAATGMRSTEAVTLTGEQLDFERQQIRLPKTKTRPRTIAMRTPGGDALPVLEPYRSRSGILFTTDEGGPYLNFSSNERNTQARAEERARRQGVPFRRFRVHDLRHAFAVRWLKAGGSIYRLSRHLGHTSVMTTEIYLQFLTAEEEERARAADV